jgi:hypothetical protein
MELKPDATTDCQECGLPMFPIAADARQVTVECANRHRGTTAAPREPKMRRLVRSWVARKGAQLHVQHERWEGDDDVE